MKTQRICITDINTGIIKMLDAPDVSYELDGTPGSPINRKHIQDFCDTVNIRNYLNGVPERAVPDFQNGSIRKYVIPNDQSHRDLKGEKQSTGHSEIDEQDKEKATRLINTAKRYIETYHEPPFGREIEGTDELLQEMSDMITKYLQVRTNR